MSANAHARLAAVACFLAILAASASVHAQYRAELIQLPAEGRAGDIKQYAAVRPDPAGELDARELFLSDEGFVPYTSELDLNAPPLWLKIRVSAPPDADGDYVLQVARRLFRQFDLYVDRAGEASRHFRATLGEPVSMETAGRRFAAGFRVPAGQVQTLLIRIETIQQSLQPLELWIEDGSSHAAGQSDSLLVLGLLFGILIALIFHNLILYLNLRQRGHLFYVLAMASVLLLLGFDAGLVQTYLLPGFMQPYAAKLYIMLAPLALLTIGLFFLAFVNPRRYLPRLTRIIQVTVVVIGAVAVGTLLVPAQHLPMLLLLWQPVQLLFQVMLVVAAFMSGRRGAMEGYIFLAAWLVFIVSGFARVFISLDLVTRTGFLEYLIYIGSVIEAIILALGLTWRVRQLYERHARAIEEQHRASRLANLDPLTDAYNRRFLQTYLEGVVTESARPRFDRAVLILDMDHFKETNDEYGHAAGDMVLRELVRRCQRMLREGDVVCRLGGDEFVVVLSDQVERSALQVAQRILQEVADRPFVFDGQELPITTSIGVVSSISPRCTVSDILRMADQALYQAKQAGRNRAVVFDPDQATPFRRGPSRAPLGHQA